MGFGPLVTAAWLLDRHAEADVVVVDCRWRLGEPGAGARLHAGGHVPGAAFLDVERDLAAPARGAGGRHPLPSPAAFERAARAAGIGAGTRVVACDEAGEGGAARLWWLLRHFGHPAAAVLDGGLRAWREAGGPLRPGPERPASGDFRARPRAGDTASFEELAGRAGGRSPALVDVRAPARFRGEREPVDPVAGHVPGAVNAPFAELAPDGRFPAPAELRARLAAAGADGAADVVFMCGSGVTAAIGVLAAERAGLAGARLYPGSWSDWCARGGPVATGDDRGGRAERAGRTPAGDDRPA